jgi:hypothetical protein
MYLYLQMEVFFHLWPKHLYLAYYKLVVVSYCQTNSYHTQNQNHYYFQYNLQASGFLLKRYRLHLTKFYVFLTQQHFYFFNFVKLVLFLSFASYYQTLDFAIWFSTKPLTRSYKPGWWRIVPSSDNVKPVGPDRLQV